MARTRRGKIIPNDQFLALINASSPSALNPFATIADIISGSTYITVEANYSALPAPNTVSGKFYWVENSQGTAWLPGSLGGTYYPKGLYYSNGVSWIVTDAPYQASQLEVNTRTNNDKFVTPLTLANSDQWDEKLDVTVFQEQNQVTKEPTGYPNRDDSTFSFDDGTRTFTIQPTGVDYDFWTQGEKHTISIAKTVILPNVTGKYFIYFDDTEVLGYTLTFDDSILNDKVFTATVYYNANTGKGEFVVDERHGLTMDWATHFHLHNAFGTRYYGGFGLAYTIGDGSSDTHGQVAMGTGTIADEDIPTTIVDAAVPSAFFEQILSPIAQIPCVYKLGTTVWQKDAATDYTYKLDTGIPQYNLDTLGTHSLEDVTDGNFFAVWLFATPEINTPIISILGNTQDVDLNSAKNNNTYSDIEWGDLPSQEYKILYRLIFQYDTTFTNTNNAALAEVTDLRGSIDAALSSDTLSPVSTHSSLIGLSSDDHPQYHNDTRGDVRYYTKAQSDLNYDPAGSASSAQAFAIQRANHTGTQLASTISNFATTVLGTLLTGLSVATAQVITSTDTILLALGYLQAQITALVPSPKIKSGVITAGTFTGNPKKATVTFGTAFADANYSVSIIGIDSRSWAIETVAAGSFIINANANLALTGNCYWVATKHGEN